jgi:hypothetical protein
MPEPQSNSVKAPLLDTKKFDLSLLAGNFTEDLLKKVYSEMVENRIRNHIDWVAYDRRRKAEGLNPAQVAGIAQEMQKVEENLATIDEVLKVVKEMMFELKVKQPN